MYLPLRVERATRSGVEKLFEAYPPMRPAGRPGFSEVSLGNDLSMRKPKNGILNLQPMPAAQCPLMALSGLDVDAEHVRFRGKADTLNQLARCLLMTLSGHPQGLLHRYPAGPLRSTTQPIARTNP